MKRRKFIQMSAGVVAAAPFVFTKRNSLWAAKAALSDIAIVTNPRAFTFQGPANGTGLWTVTLNQAAINSMVDAAIMRLTGAANVGLAWETVIRNKVPGLSATTKIGLKINTSTLPKENGGDYPAAQKCPYFVRGEVVTAIINGLKQMLGGTYKIENVTAFDKVNQTNFSSYMPANGFPAGGSNGTYDVGGSTGQYRCVLVDSSKAANLSSNYLLVNSFPNGPSVTINEPLLNVVTQQQVWINLAIPKVNIGAGVTASFKNTYGMVRNCGNTHPDNYRAGTTIDGYLSTTVIHDCVGWFYKKINDQFPCAINILDALAGIYAKETYAGPTFCANKIAMSTDPVTTDFLAVELINATRTPNQWDVITTPAVTADRYHFHSAYFPGTINSSTAHPDDPLAERFYSKYVNCHSLAFAEQLGLGNLNAGNRLAVDQTAVRDAGDLPSLDNPQGRSLGVTRYSGGWRMDIQLDRSGRTHRIESRILDIYGREVRSFTTRSTSQSLMSIDWDGRNAYGSGTAPGLYCWETRIDGVVNSQSIHQQ